MLRGRSDLWQTPISPLLDSWAFDPKVRFNNAPIFLTWIRIYFQGLKYPKAMAIGLKLEALLQIQPGIQHTKTPQKYSKTCL